MRIPAQDINEALVSRTKARAVGTCVLCGAWASHWMAESFPHEETCLYWRIVATPSEDDFDQILKKHSEYELDDVTGRLFCGSCMIPWPCETIRLVERARELAGATLLAIHKIEQTLDGQYREGQALKAALFVLKESHPELLRTKI